MDKETLSNYGWIVICIMVLAVMIALATPFGEFIRDAVWNTANGLFDTSNNAMNSLGSLVKEQSWQSKNPFGAIPDGATYYIANTGVTLVAGDSFPDSVGNFDKYTYEDYAYEYDAVIGGWGVFVLNTDMESYGVIMETINGEAIVSMSYTFSACDALKTAPAIPDTVVDLSWAFYGCTNLTHAPAIPDRVVDMEGTFYNCGLVDGGVPVLCGNVVSLKNTFVGCDFTIAPVIPEGVVDMTQTFKDCDKLLSAPVIPSTAFNMDATFDGCISMSGIVRVPCGALVNGSTIPSGCTLETFHTDGCSE